VGYGSVSDGTGITRAGADLCGNRRCRGIPESDADPVGTFNHDTRFHVHFDAVAGSKERPNSRWSVGRKHQCVAGITPKTSCLVVSVIPHASSATPLSRYDGRRGPCWEDPASMPKRRKQLSVGKRTSWHGWFQWARESSSLSFRYRNSVRNAPDVVRESPGTLRRPPEPPRKLPETESDVSDRVIRPPAGVGSLPEDKRRLHQSKRNAAPDMRKPPQTKSDLPPDQRRPSGTRGKAPETSSKFPQGVGTLPHAT